MLTALGSEEGEQQLGGVNLPPASSCDAYGTGTASVCVFKTPKHHARPACATPASKTLTVVPLRVLALNRVPFLLQLCLPKGGCCQSLTQLHFPLQAAPDQNYGRRHPLRR